MTAHTASGGAGRVTVPLQQSAAEDIVIGSDEDVIRARQLVRARAVVARLSLADQTKLVTAASELARNTLVHGGGGKVRVEIVSDEGRLGVRATFTDSGPGIPDVPLALTDGYSTGRGLGLGLGGARRLVDEFSLDSGPDRGTRVMLTSWAR